MKTGANTTHSEDVKIYRSNYHNKALGPPLDTASVREDKDIDALQEDYPVNTYVLTVNGVSITRDILGVWRYNSEIMADVQKVFA